MIKFLLEKELKLIFRNTIFVRIIIAMPIVMMIVLPFAANMEVRNINLVVVNSDRSMRSLQLIEKVTSSGYFDLVGTVDSYDIAMNSIEGGTADVILEIPQDFGRDLMDRNSDVLIVANAVNAVKGSMGSSYLSSIVQNFSQEVAQEVGMAYELPINMVTQHRFNPLLNYRYFMVPALMIMLLTIMCAFLSALNIVGEKESGTIEQMNVTPVSKFSFILGKQILYWMIGIMVFSVSLLIAKVVFGLSPLGSIWLLYLSAIVFIMTMSAFGLLISNGSQTMQQAMFTMFFFILILVLLSGLFTPIQSMPDWAKTLTLFNPLRYMIQIMRGVYLKASDFSDIWEPLRTLIYFLIIFVTCAVWSYRKSS